MSPPWRTCALHAQRGAVLSITPSSGKQAFPFTVENECSPLPPQWRTGAFHYQWRMGDPLLAPVENKRSPVPQLPVENKRAPLPVSGDRVFSTSHPMENKRSPFPMENGCPRFAPQRWTGALHSPLGVANTCSPPEGWPFGGYSRTPVLHHWGWRTPVLHGGGGGVENTRPSL